MSDRNEREGHEGRHGSGETPRLDRLEQLVYSLVRPDGNGDKSVQASIDELGKDLFIAEAQRLFEREPETYKTVEEAGVALGTFLNKIKNGDLMLNPETGEYVPRIRYS